MSELYELNGEIFESIGEFLTAMAHEYKTGGKDIVLTKLEEYGFDLSDLSVHPNDR